MEKELVKMVKDGDRVFGEISPDYSHEKPLRPVRARIKLTVGSETNNSNRVIEKILDNK